MNDSAWQLLWVGTAPAGEPWRPDGGAGPFVASFCAVDEAAERLAEAPVDLLVVAADWQGWRRHAELTAVVICRAGAAAADAVECLQVGAQDVLDLSPAGGADRAFRLRAAVERQRLRVAERQSFATDVTTGLPHEGQLIEHMSHLLALREREPAPMALLVLRIEGFASTAARLGDDTAGALRRKVAVRLRAGVRASDVVASLGADSFAVLLSSIDAPGDAETVGRKLLAALSQTFTLAGTDVALSAALGVAASVGDGAQPAALLHRAVGLAASAQALGRRGHASRVEAREAPTAANDD